MEFDWRDASNELAKPLDGYYVKEREIAGRKMSYIEGWHAISEANRIFGFDGWTRETAELKETNRDLVTLSGSRGNYQQWRVGYVARVRIVARGVIREGTGYGSGMSKPEALGDAIESASKEAETDAMKRALMTFGNPFGLALYDKMKENVDYGETDKKPVKAAHVAVKTFEALKDDLSKITTQGFINEWIDSVKASIAHGGVSNSEKAMLSSLLEARRAFLAQSLEEMK